MKKILYICLIIPIFVYANPSPFGLKIGQVTPEETKMKYHTLYKVYDDKYPQLDTYAIEPTEFTIHGMKQATLAYKSNKLVYILTRFNKDKFNYFFDLLSKKYTVVFKETPNGGDKFVSFSDGETLIWIISINSDADMGLNYMDKKTFREIMTFKGS